MHCREFLRKHDAFIDDTLSGVDIEAMETHRRVCEHCSHRDTRVRRALLLARNVPSIQPSAQFSERLNMRLKQERAARDLLRVTALSAPSSPSRSIGTYSVVAAGLLMAVGVASVALRTQAHEQIAVRLAPVVATQPAEFPSALTAPTLVAATPAGMPFWPAVFVAQEAPWHLASDEAGR